jgi:hypothetical protein
MKPAKKRPMMAARKSFADVERRMGGESTLTPRRPLKSKKKDEG